MIVKLKMLQLKNFSYVTDPKGDVEFLWMQRLAPIKKKKKKKPGT